MPGVFLGFFYTFNVYISPFLSDFLYIKAEILIKITQFLEFGFQEYKAMQDCF